VVNLRERLRGVWRELDGADPMAHAHKLANNISSDKSYMDGLASQAKHCKGPSPFAA